MLAAIENALGEAHRFVIGLSSWRKLFFGAFIGALTVFAHAPYFFLLVLPVGYTCLIWIFDSSAQQARRRKSAFSAGWSFGFGYMYAGIYWMAFSFLHHASSASHLVILAVVGFICVGFLSAFVALFYGAVSAALISFWSRDWTRILIFSVFWSIAEYARGHLLTGLPWNLTGQAFAATPLLSQLAAFVGPYGLSLIVLVIATLPALAIRSRKLELRPLGYAAGSFLMVVLFGFIRLTPNPTEFYTDVHVQVVQPNVAMVDKINPEKFGQNFLAALENSGGGEVEASSVQGDVFIIWPENAAYAYFHTTPGSPPSAAMEMVAERLPGNAKLLTGASRIDDQDPSETRYFNSLLAISGDPDTSQWDVVANYDKHHLAPFGEYVPLKGILTAVGVDKIVPLNDAWDRGTGPAVLEMGTTKVAPVICYETIFPGRLFPRNDRPDWVVTVTNDAWFGDSVGPSQHLAQARLRAIESGVAVVRSANTGISAIIDPFGRILQTLPLSEQGAIFSALPKPTKPTVYSRVGDLLYWIILIAIAAFALRGTLVYAKG